VLVEVVSVRKGDIIAPNQPILKVLRADDLWVKIYVPETQLGQLRLNQEVEVTVDSYPDRRFSGTIMLIAAESEFTPRNVQSADERRHQVFGVKVRVPNPEGIFKSGMAAEVIVPLQ
jgi:multidrug resistance efflux pump